MERNITWLKFTSLGLDFFRRHRCDFFHNLVGELRVLRLIYPHANIDEHLSRLRVKVDWRLAVLAGDGLGNNAVFVLGENGLDHRLGVGEVVLRGGHASEEVCAVERDIHGGRGAELFLQLAFFHTCLDLDRIDAVG